LDCSLRLHLHGHGLVIQHDTEAAMAVRQCEHDTRRLTVHV